MPLEGFHQRFIYELHVHASICHLAHYIMLYFLCQEQEAALRSTPDIVVATPGRMLDHLCNSIGVHLDDLAVLILDEADRLLEIGFSAEIRELVYMLWPRSCTASMTSIEICPFTLSNHLWFIRQIRLCPQKRQTMLFSATMNTELDELVKLSLNNPVRLSADPSAKRPARLTEE